MTEAPLERRAVPHDREIYDPDCTRCPRLAGFLAEIRHKYPDYWARPVPSFGADDPVILIVGLAPGLHGANRTSRPFTGDFAGILLYESLYELGLATRPVSLGADDGLELLNTRIVNSVKCVPPENKPRPDEVRRCNDYLRAEVARLARVRVYVALGRVGHDAFLLASSLRPREHPFAHGREHRLESGRVLIDSYHCSRYNTQTGRLTPGMFKTVMARARELADLQ